MVRETRLTVEQLVLPLFACEGEGMRREVASMPGVFNLSIDEITREAQAAAEDGIRAVLLFGIPDAKDETASEAFARNGIAQRAITAVKKNCAGDDGDCRYMFVRIHVARALRCCARRRSFE